jgi:uncharacterized protein (TIGR04222 family)
MNPFDLSGPDFLVFYLIFTIIVAAGLKLAIAGAEGGRPPALPLSDPYQIAWLRGGTPEAARIAVLSLTDRRLLELSGETLKNPRPAETHVREPIETAILTRCSQFGTAATAVLTDAEVDRACAPYRARLERMQLIPDGATKARRYRWFAVAVALLLGAAVIKIEVAFGRERHNVAFLIILTLIAVGVTWLLVNRRRTSLGDQIIKDLRRLFAALQQRAPSIRPGGAMTSDAMLLAAVFGLSALPAGAFADLLKVYRKSANSSGGGGCGSACGSGCGGGGGGGGCGGCGSSS